MATPYQIALTLTIITLLARPCTAAGQDSMILAKGPNLVPNPSFEAHQKCPPHCTVLPKSYFVDEWSMPTIGTPDYFNKCANSAGVPHNWAGYLPAKSGKGYVGLIAGKYITKIKNLEVREYVQARLSKPLAPGQDYVVRFYISLAQRSRFAIDGMGAYFSDKQIDTLDYMGPLPVAPQISYTGDIIETQGKWKEINGVFTARGGEEFIIIGNFKNDKNTRWKELPQFGQYYYAYYHVDNVSVRPIPRGQPARFADSVRYEKYIGKPVELDHIYFEVDKATLLPASYPQLDRLAGYMKKYPRLTIQVSGHTDSTGTASYNLDLSHRRANAVAQYLHEQEIVPKRVSAKGFGYNKPVATNQTEKGRGQNRRVEFLITGW